LRAALGRGELSKIEGGLYSSRPHAGKFEVIAKKYPFAIVAGETAHYLHGLTDVIPATIQLATKRNATRISDSAITQIFVEERLFAPGKTTIEYEGIKVGIYDRERLLVELLRRSNSVPFDYYKELITSYRRIAESLDFSTIESYIGLYKRGANIFDKLQREVL
jgi:predicted transcriptional regulator of viral defense system